MSLPSCFFLGWVGGWGGGCRPSASERRAALAAPQPTPTESPPGRFRPHPTGPPLSNKKASNKKLDSQISNFNTKIKDLIRKSNENSLLRDKKSRLSLEKSSFLLDGRGCIILIINILS